MRRLRLSETDSSRRFRGFAGALLVCALGAVASVPVPAGAQTPTGQGTDEGPQRGRSYFSPEPFEYFDFQNGDLQLSFTDLVLPGNAGRDLRFVRSYSNLGLGWKFGIAGIVMQVQGGYLPTHWEITTETAYQVYTQSAPKLVMGDGGTRQTFFTQDPDPEVPSTQHIVKTADHIVYNQNTRKVFMPNGVVCQYYPQGAPFYGRLDYCDDPFGRFLTFIPTNWPSAWTFRQEVGNGQVRDVLFTGATPGGIATMTYEDRVWQYVYSSSKLTTVTTPVGSSWTFTYDPSSSMWVTFLKSVTTPGGGYIEYTYADHWQTHPEAPDPFDNHFHGYLLTTRSASGPDVEPGTWTITPDYTDHGPQESEHSRPVPAVRMTLLLPSGVAREWVNCYGPPANPDVRLWIVGNLPFGGFDTGYPKEFGPLLPRPLLIAYQWATLYTQDAIGSILVADKSDPNTLLSTHGLVHTTFDAYRQPTTTLESSSLYPGRQRQTTRTYLNLVPASFHAPTMPYILGLPQSETVTLDGESVTRSWTYNTANGFRTSETIAGTTTTFSPDARGNVATVTKANGKATHYVFEGGAVQEIQTPEHTITRVIDAYGQIESETQGDVTTEYEYDLPGRRTTTHVLGTNEVVTTYNDAARMVTTDRGASTVTTWLDGFGRPLETLTGAGVRTRTEYDARRACDATEPAVPEWGHAGLDGLRVRLDRACHERNAR